jgi:hypothetical protein
MKAIRKDYEDIVEEIISDPESYSVWSLDEDSEDVRNIINENIWRNDDN